MARNFIASLSSVWTESESQPLNIEFLDRSQRLRRLPFVEYLLKLSIANGIEDNPVLLAQNFFLFLIGEAWALGLFCIRGCAFTDTASADENLCLQEHVGLAGLALHVVNRVLVLDVGIKAKDHIGVISVIQKVSVRNDYGSSGEAHIRPLLLHACPNSPTAPIPRKPCHINGGSNCLPSHNGDRTMTRFALVLVIVSQFAISQSMFHGNLAHTGVYDSAGPTEFHDVKWTFHTSAAIVASPAIADGVVFIPSMDGHLYAIDQETGKEKWNFKSSMPIASSPAVAGGLIYFVSSGGALDAIDVATGKVKWFLPTEYERKFEARNLHGYPSPAQTMPDPWDMFTSSPAVANGKVFFGSGDGSVYAADAQTGVLQWKFRAQDVVHASPAVVGNTVYVGSWDSYLYAIDAETGQQKWAFKTAKIPPFIIRLGFNLRRRSLTAWFTLAAAMLTSMQLTP